MELLQGFPKFHDWGSKTRIPNFLGEPPTNKPLAELWFGAHPSGSAYLSDGTELLHAIETNPTAYLGPSTQFSFGKQLPFLLKLIAPDSPLSMQVHPGRRSSASGFAQEEHNGPPPESDSRIYKDSTHKPEMIYALSDYDALIGFAVRRQARLRLEGLKSKTASRLSMRLLMAKGRGVKPVVSWILDPKDGPSPTDITQFAEDCETRLSNANSPHSFIDKTSVSLHNKFGPDPAILVAFLMNHLRLKAGHAIFVPPGTVHSYQNGFGVEVMANSDNVIRAGLTNKHVATDLFLEVADFDGGAPVRIAPEIPIPGISLYRSPIEDFELLTATVNHANSAPLPFPVAGPKVTLCLNGTIRLTTGTQNMEVTQGQSVFIRDADGPTVASGDGKLIICSVP